VSQSEDHEITLSLVSNNPQDLPRRGATIPGLLPFLYTVTPLNSVLDFDFFFFFLLHKQVMIYYPPRLVYGSDGGASIVRDLSLAGVLSDKPRFILVLGYHIWCFFDILPSETRLRVGWWFLYDQRFISVGFLAKIYLGLDF